MEHFIYANGKKLRLGYTTGSSATLAAKACAIMLLSGEKVEKSTILTPKGIEVCVDIIDLQINERFVSCAVRKDGGDDIDATDKALIYAKVSLISRGITIDGGVGVGRVTEKGLDQPVGSAAINSVPRAMICENLTQVARDFGYKGGFCVEIYVPDGEKIAKKTFNANLGIIGGISILGTTGIVEPQSVKALVDSIEVELRQLQAKGVRDIIISPGNYSDSFLEKDEFLRQIPSVKCSNFIGETLDLATIYGFENVLLVGHIGKFAKLSAGIMNTHSRVADGRVQIFASNAALNGASRDTVFEIMHSKTTDACIEILKNAQIFDETMQDIINSAQNHLENRVDFNIGVLMFSNVYGNLGRSENADKIIESWAKK